MKFKIHVILGLGILAGCLLLSMSCNDSSNDDDGITQSQDTEAFRAWLNSNAVSIASTDPAETNYDDLQAFGDAVGDARIVMLDEQTHGEGNVFSLKNRLIQYLHEEKGFNVLIIESGFYDVNTIYRRAVAGTASIESQVGNSLFFMYANSTEMLPLFRYIDAQLLTASPLIFAGMDSQHTARVSQQDMMNELEALLLSWSSSVPADPGWPIFKALANRLFEYNPVRPSSADEATYFAILNQLEVAITLALAASQTTEQESGFWLRITDSLSNQATRYWYNGSSIDRSPTMGGNAAWLAQVMYPTEKIIIWAHTIHLAKNGLGSVNNAGRVIAAEFGSDVYLAHITGYQGQYTDFTTMNNMPYSFGATGQLESVWHGLGMPLGFFDFAAPGFAEAQQGITAASAFSVLPSSRWRPAWDGVFFIDTMTAVDYNAP